MTVLRQRMTEDMQVRNLSFNTQRVYLEQVTRFARHFDKSPALLGPEEIRPYQVYLTIEKELAAGSIQIAIVALRFLYRVTLKKDWRCDEVLPHPKAPEKLPIVLSRLRQQRLLAVAIAAVRPAVAGLAIHVMVHLGVQRTFRQRPLQVVEQTVLAENCLRVPTCRQLVQ